MVSKYLYYTISSLLCALFFVYGCTSSYPNLTSVKEYHAQVELESWETPEANEEQRQDIEQMRDTKKNLVFIEEDGLPHYRIGPEDVLELTFWEGTKPNLFITKVRPDGTISYSFLDDIMVSGLTALQVDKELTQRLKRYLRNVRIDVAVTKYESKNALLFGEINILQTGKSGPGKYALRGRMTVLDLIVDAGGYTQDSDLKNVELVREGKQYTLNLYEAMFKGDMTQNVVIDDGDVVTVPELPEFGERVYVFGEVLDEGIYAHDDAFDLLAALGKAKGTLPTAMRGEIKIIRGYAKGEPVILTASLDDILDRGDIRQNIPLIDGDVVYVPRSAIGDVNEFILNTTPLLDYLFYPNRYKEAYWPAAW